MWNHSNLTSFQGIARKDVTVTVPYTRAGMWLTSQAWHDRNPRAMNVAASSQTPLYSSTMKLCKAFWTGFLIPDLARMDSFQGVSGDKWNHLPEKTMFYAKIHHILKVSEVNPQVLIWSLRCRTDMHGCCLLTCWRNHIRSVLSFPPRINSSRCEHGGLYT